MFMLTSTSGVNDSCQSFLSLQTEGPVNPTSPQSDRQVIGDSDVPEESSREHGAQEDAVQPIDCASVATIIDLTGLSQDHQLEVGDGK